MGTLYLPLFYKMETEMVRMHLPLKEAAEPGQKPFEREAPPCEF